MKSEFPRDVARVIRSQIDDWLEELDLLLRDPRVRRFFEQQRRIDGADGSPGPGSLGHGEPLGGRKGNGIPTNELSAFKADDLEDPVVRSPPGDWG